MRRISDMHHCRLHLLVHSSGEEMSMYCERCGEEPVLELMYCYTCEMNLCETCYGRSDNEQCRACRIADHDNEAVSIQALEAQQEREKLAAWNEGRPRT